MLLTLAAVASAVLKSNSSHVKQQYLTWLWSLLLSSVGKALAQVDSSDVEDVQELCLAEVTTGIALRKHVNPAWDHDFAA